MNALQPISLEARGAFKDAFARGKQKGYVHFFPFLYCYSLSRRWELLFSEDSGSLCVFFRKKNQKDPARERLSLLFPPVPMNRTALKNAIALINDHNKDNAARIWRIDEHDAHEIARMPELELRVRFREEEYLYDPKLYREMAGAKFSKMRNDFNHLRRIFTLDVLPYDVKYADQCLDLLEKWEVSQGVKYDALSDRVHTRNCLKMADKFESPDLFGRVILVNDELKSFGFAGEMYDQMGSCFIVKSDLSIPGLNNLMWCRLMLLLESSTLVNGSSDMGHPGLKFAKKMLRPVEMAKIFTAKG